MIPELDFSYPRRVHFIGIGGAGMSGLAQLLLQQGHQVTGSDIDNQNVYIDRIRKLGGQVFYGHRPENINGAEVVVYSSCIREDNPEILQAKAQNIEVVPRACVLAELMKDKISIAVSGTHGKTTTTSLISLIISRAGWDPSIVIGGEVDDFGGNACLGRGDYLVAEADESDGSFLYLNQTHTVVTNIEPEHMDYFGHMDRVLEIYEQFINNGSVSGLFVGCLDDENIAIIQTRVRNKRIINYGFSPQTETYPDNIELKDMGSEFDLIYMGEKLGRLELQIPGRHNILNTLAAASITLALGIDFSTIQSALFLYRGAQRRFEIKLNTPDIMVIDDYAHHPTEIKATIAAARHNFDGRLISVFQPHRYTRTKLLRQSFGACFEGVDKLFLTDIYPAGEPVLEGVSGRSIYDEVRASGLKDVIYLPDKESIVPYILKTIRRGDRLLIMGAGDITRTADELVKQIEVKQVGCGSVHS